MEAVPSQAGLREGLPLAMLRRALACCVDCKRSISTLCHSCLEPLLQAWANPDVEQQMALAQSVVSAARKLRSDYNLQREKPKMFIAVRTVVVHLGSAAGSAGSRAQAYSTAAGMERLVHPSVKSAAPELCDAAGNWLLVALHRHAWALLG